MKLNKKNFRIIKRSSVVVPCYFYGYFKSPGLKTYPNLFWVNDDYNLIKSDKIFDEDCLRIAYNLFNVGQQFDLFKNLDYFIMMPLKPTSISNLEKIILKLILIIEKELSLNIKLISDLFLIENYRKFWENRLNLSQRRKEIAKKIDLKKDYYHFFDNKNIIIIDDVVSTGTSILSVSELLQKFNKKTSITALTYGSVYLWEKIY